MISLLFSLLNRQFTISVKRFSDIIYFLYLNLKQCRERENLLRKIKNSARKNKFCYNVYHEKSMRMKKIIGNCARIINKMKIAYNV